MTFIQPADHHTTTGPADEFDDLVSSWRRHLRAQRMRTATIAT